MYEGFLFGLEREAISIRVSLKIPEANAAVDQKVEKWTKKNSQFGTKKSKQGRSLSVKRMKVEKQSTSGT